MFGRKQHLLVDTLGLIIAAVVHTADVQDRDGAKDVLAKANWEVGRLKIVRADGGYAGTLVAWTLAACGWVVEIVRRPKGSTGFVLLPKRWVVERRVPLASRQCRTCLCVTTW